MEELIHELEELAAGDQDEETDHRIADSMLLHIIRAVAERGLTLDMSQFRRIERAYDRVEKWYA